MNPTLSTAPTDWAYQAEGGANLVLSYAGPERRWQGKLLRLSKPARRSARTQADALSPAEEDELESGWATDVIAPLLGKEFVLDLEAFDVSQEWLSVAAEVVDASSHRPQERREGLAIDLDAPKVWLVDNLIHGEHTFALEIKVSFTSQICVCGSLSC